MAREGLGEKEGERERGREREEKKIGVRDQKSRKVNDLMDQRDELHKKK